MLDGKSILVVDDEPDLREILSDEFSLDGAKVSEAPNGKEALKKCEAEAFDVVVSDLRMPGGDGVVLARELKARHSEKPLVFLMTGFADLTAEEAYEIGVEGFFSKPFHLETVRQNVTRLMLPRSSRWEVAVATPAKQIDVPRSVLEAHPTAAYLGRGGIFLPGEKPQLRMGDEVRFVSGTELSGVGVVRWVRSAPQGGRGPGFGIEFLYLEPESRKWVLQQIESSTFSAYLPRGF